MSAGSLGSASYEFQVRMEGFIAGLNAAKAQAQSANNSIGASFQQMGQKLSQAGQQLSLGVTLPIAGAAAAVLKAGSDFETAFTGIQKTVSATPEQFAALNAEIRQMALDIPVTREELAGIGQVAGQLGVEVENITNFTDTVARLGVATNLSAEQAAGQFARLFNILGEGNDAIDEFGSVVVDLGNNFATTEAEILDMASRLAPVLATFDVGTGEVLAFATALSAMNIQAEAGGTALGRLFITIGDAVAKGGDDLAKFAEVAGMTVEQFGTLFAKDAAAGVQAFVEGLSQMDSTGQETIALLEELGISEIRLRQATLALSEGYDTLDAAMIRQGTEFARTGALAQESERRFATFASQIQILKNQLSDAGVELFQSLRPALMQFVEIAIDAAEVLGALAEAFGQLSPQTQSFVLGALAVAAAAGPAAVGIGLIVTSLGALAGPVGVAVLAIAALGGIAAALAVDIEPDTRRWEEAITSLGQTVEDFPPPPEEQGRRWGRFLSDWAEYDWDDFFNHVSEFVEKSRELADPGLADDFDEEIAKLADDMEAIEELRRIAQGDTGKRDVPFLDELLGVDRYSDAAIEARNLLKQIEEFQRVRDLDIRLDLQADINQINQEIDAVAQQAADAASQTVIPLGPIFTTDQINVPRLRDALAEVPEMVGDVAAHTLLAVQRGTLQWADAWEIFSKVPREELEPQIEALGDELQEKFINALIEGVPTDQIEQQIAVLAQLFPDIVGPAADAAEKYKRIADGVTTGITGWAQAQSFLDQSIKSSSDAISSWESQQGDVERAMEITQRRFDEGKISADEYNETMAFLQQAHDRIAAGITDDLEPAFVESVRNREELRNIIDETTKAIDDEIAKNDTSAEGQQRLADLTAARDRAQRDFTAALIGSEDPQERMIGHQYELADAFGTIIGELRSLLTDLGLLDDTEAEPEITVDTAASEEDIQFLEDNITNFPDGKEVNFTTPDIDQTRERIAFLEDNVANFPQPSELVWQSNDTAVTESLSRIGSGIDAFEQQEIIPPKLDVDEADAITGIDHVRNRLTDLEGGYYSVDVDANIAPALNKLGTLAQSLPQSPAEEGPLAFTPDWDYIFEGLPESASHFSEETLKHIQNFVSTAQAAFDLFNTSLEFALDARSFSGRLPELGFIQELAAFSTSVTAEVGFLAQQFEADFLENTQRFNTTAQGALATITEAFDTIQHIFEDPDLPAFPPGSLEPIFGFIEITMAGIAGLSEAFQPQTLVLVEGYTRAATAVLEMITLAATTLREIDGLQPNLEAALRAVTEIKFLTEHAMLAVGDSAAVMNSSQGQVNHPAARGEGFVGAAESFATSAVEVLKLMTAGAELIGALSDLERFDLAGAKDFTTNLKFLIEHIMLSVGDTAAVMNSSQGAVDHPAARGEGFVGAAGAFAESAQQVVALMAEALGFMADLAAFEGQFNLARAEQFASDLKFLIEHIAESIGDTVQHLEATRGSELLDGVEEFSSAVSAAVGALLDVLQFAQEVSANMDAILEHLDQVDDYALALSAVALRIAVHFDSVASTFEETEEGAIAAFSTAISDAVAGLSAVVDFAVTLTENIENVLDMLDQADDYALALSAVALRIAVSFDSVAKSWEETEAGSIADLSTAVQDSTGALGETLSFLQALSGMTESAWEASGDVDAAARQLSEIALILAQEFAEAADDWEAEVNPAISDFATAVSDSTGALGEVLSFLGALKSLSEQKGDANFSRGLADRLSAMAREIAEAVAQAADDWATEANPQIAAFSEDVQASAGALNSIVSLLKNLQPDDDGKRIKFDASALSPLFSGMRYIVGQFRSLAEQVDGEGVQSVVAIVDALETIRTLFDDAPQSGEAVEDATRQWAEAVERAFEIISAVADGMAGVRSDAERYQAAAEAIAAAIAAGNFALSGIEGLDFEGGFDANLGAPPEITTPGTTSNPPLSLVPTPAGQPAAAGPFVVNNLLDGARFQKLIADENGNVTKRTYA